MKSIMQYVLFHSLTAICICVESKPKDIVATENPYQDSVSRFSVGKPIHFSHYA